MKLANVIYSFKYGIFLQNFKIWLGRHLGFRFFPYYLMEEGSSVLSNSGSDPEGFELCVINHEDLQNPDQFGPSVRLEQWKQRLEKGHVCIALRKSGEVAAYCWADTKEFNFRPESFSLKKEEAYLYDAYVEDTFRGQGLAPYMRIQCYRLLNSRGFNRFYSVSDYFNTPTHRFKKKLNARAVRLVLKIELRRKEICHIVIRDYLKGSETSASNDGLVDKDLS